MLKDITLGQYFPGNSIISQIISGKHSVYVRIINRPESFLNIHGIRITTGDNQYFYIGTDSSLFFKLFEFFNQ